MSKKKFVIVVDAQYDFMNENGKLYINESKDLISALETWLSNLSGDDIEGILFTKDTHNQLTYPISEERNEFPPHCYKGTLGWETVVPTYHPAITTYHLEKDVFDMWKDDESEVVSTYAMVNHMRGVGVDLVKRDDFFEKLKETVDTVIVIGVASDYCVKYTIEGLLERNFKVEVVKELTKGINQDIDIVVKEHFPKKVKFIK